MSESLKPDDVLAALRAIGNGQTLGLDDEALGPLIAGAGDFGVSPEEAETALDPTGKGASWQRELRQEMATDTNLRSLVRAILQP
ncbi:MAG TPA: hypothetical protein VMW29_01520 [Candidatus Bathyarchaeia archaeon]|nr:hypothetical protein [Candidatus Bathyarchaeia archaeon]